jgi:hypothetical protein
VETEAGFTAAPSTSAPPTTNGPSTSAPVELVTTPASPPTTDPNVAAPPTTAIAVTTPPVSPADTIAPGPEASDASVLALATVLGVEGEVEHVHSNGSCIGRLEPRGLCVNVPIPSAWQYWDAEADNLPGASDQDASAAALDVFTRIGVDPGVVQSIEPNGPHPQVTLGNGAVVRVAEGGRIAWIIAAVDQMPPVQGSG